MNHSKTFLSISLVAFVFTMLVPLAATAQEPYTLEDGQGGASQRHQGLEDQIEDLLLEFYEASTFADIDTIADLISRSPKALFFGTDPSEVFVGSDDIVAWWEGIFAALDSIGYPNNGGLPLTSTGSPVQIGHRGSVAWVADEPTFDFLNGQVPVRLTLVLRKERGEWRIIQGHFSIGVPDTDLPI